MDEVDSLPGMSEDAARAAKQQLVNELYRATGQAKIPGAVAHLQQLLDAGECYHLHPCFKACLQQCSLEFLTLDRIEHGILQVTRCLFLLIMVLSWTLWRMQQRA